MKYLHDGAYRALFDRMEASLAGVPELRDFELALHLDAERFERMFDWEREASIAHETAHAWRHAQKIDDTSDECWEADLCATRWLGQVHAQKQIDTKYREILALALTDERAAREQYGEYVRLRDIVAQFVHRLE